MGSLIDFAIYNPGILSDSDFLAGYVARQDLTDNLLSRLREVTKTGLAQHHLILGQRGMGKTSLLRRLALGVTTDPDLAAILVPLTFREEQYNVHNLHVFWCNCLDALGDWFERTGRADEAAEIDRDVATLCKGRQPDADGRDAQAAFKRWTKRVGRRPLLLLDNLDLILGGLAKHDWALRGALQEKGGVVVVGASAGYLEATANTEAAFHDFFQVTVLEKLSDTEMTACLRRLAEARGDAGKNVLRVLDEDPGRVRTLYDLTGGNPRTLVLVYLLLESDGGDDVMVDLERLLDQVTVFYKARVEDLAPQQRVVLDAVALHWDPVTAAALAEVTGLEVQVVSSQLDRLSKAGVLEKVSVSTTVRAAFQVSERFFNIWYLMRHGPRRQRARLRWLTGFLRGFYTPEQLEMKARTLLSNGKNERPDQAAYYVALSDAVENRILKNMLLSVARFALERAALPTGRLPEVGLDLADLPGPENAQEWLGSGLSLLLLGRKDEGFNAFNKARNIDMELYTITIKLLRAYAIRLQLKSPEDSNTESCLWEAMADVALDDYGAVVDAEEWYGRALIEAPRNHSAEAALLTVLLGQPKRMAEAEALFESVVARSPAVEAALLRAYRAIALDNVGDAMGFLATVLDPASPDLFEVHWIKLLRTLRFSAARGHGERILTCLDERGLSDRLWPLRAAFDALLHGKERLQDVNPEVRGAALKILEALAPAKLPSSAAAIGRDAPGSREKKLRKRP